MNNGHGHRQPHLPSPEEIERMTNPTGGAQTPTPWRSSDTQDGHHLVAGARHIATFPRAEDRDFAMFWANTHTGIIPLLRGFKLAFEFIARGTEDESGFAKNQAMIAGIWEEFFTTLGASARQHVDALVDDAGEQP